MPERENTAAGIVHPETVDGRRIWIDPEVQEIIHALHYGVPTLGWEGDPALALYRTVDKRWELWRLENDGEYRRFCRSTPNAKLDHSLILQLVAHDVRRGYNPHTAIVQHMTKLENDRDKEAQEKMTESLEKVYYGLKKDVGHLY